MLNFFNRHQNYFSRDVGDFLGDSPVGNVGDLPGHHGDALDDGADGEAEGATGARVVDGGEMGFGVELDCLVTAVVARHVALSCEKY